MANTYTQIYIQAVFAVQGRQNLIRPERKEELHKYITGIITRQGQKLLAIHCMPDHTHILIGLKPNMALSNLVGDIQTGSTNVSVRGSHLVRRRSAASTVRCAEVSRSDFFAAFLTIVAFAIGHLAHPFDSMHQHLFRMSRSPAVRQHRGQGFTWQVIGQGHSEFTKRGPGEIRCLREVRHIDSACGAQR